MQQYHNLVQKILDKGCLKSDRTGTGTYSLFGEQLRFKMEDGFPLLTTKKTHWKSIAVELLWFLRGDTNIKYLNDNGVSIWDEWADENGELGPVYGSQWRTWKAEDGRVIDQIRQVEDRLRVNPDDRRLIVSAWNVGEIDKMALPPCHLLFQLYVGRDSRLSLHMYQRSADIFLGVPFNIASYALLLMMMGQVCKLAVDELIITFGDCHVYLNHIDQCKEMLSRQHKHPPVVWLNPENKRSVTDYQLADIHLDGYEYHPAIKAPVAV